MACNNGLFGGSCCTWIIILLILWIFCGNGGDALFGNNNGGCGCGNDDYRGGCGCGC
ncbi:MAG: hypothetical protein NC122_04200 [Faecalibacterium sp.]|nr:hypothetical protein [Ruminococcus sp.]MCM1392204.1 hypothetical protein [Ruminococcus sp.]MCM1485386.1 hypothetical protein [Faecalibacterium sp.]